MRGYIRQHVTSNCCQIYPLIFSNNSPLLFVIDHPMQNFEFRHCLWMICLFNRPFAEYHFLKIELSRSLFEEKLPLPLFRMKTTKRICGLEIRLTCIWKKDLTLSIILVSFLSFPYLIYIKFSYVKP